LVSASFVVLLFLINFSVIPLLLPIFIVIRIIFCIYSGVGRKRLIFSHFRRSFIFFCKTHEYFISYSIAVTSLFSVFFSFLYLYFSWKTAVGKLNPFYSAGQKFAVISDEGIQKHAVIFETNLN